MSDSPYPQPGTPAPDFDLPASTGGNVKLADFAGKPFVLYFYPNADTPGCTTEACGFQAARPQYQSADVAVVGVSPDPLGPVEKFAKKFDLEFPLLADEDHAVCERYGVWQEKTNFGKTYMGAARTTFLINKDGKIAKVFEKVKPDGHDEEVLAAARELK